MTLDELAVFRCSLCGCVVDLSPDNAEKVRADRDREWPPPQIRVVCASCRTKSFIFEVNDDS